jgi:hypothetical protein
MTESGTYEPGQPGDQDRLERSPFDVQDESNPPPPKKPGKITGKLIASFEIELDQPADDETEE